MSKQVPVIIISSDAWAAPTAVTIQSILDHFEGERPLKVYVFSPDMTEENADRLRSYCAENVSVEVVKADVSIFEQFRDVDYPVPPMSLMRTQLAELLPQYDKMLVIDNDLIFKKDISPLLDVDLDGYYAAGVADMVAMEMLQWHKRLHRMRYVNGGVLLHNSRRMREENIFQKCIQVKKEHPEYVCYEQDVFNDVFNDEILYLPPKWNLMTYNLVTWAQYSINHINTFFGTDYKTFQELEDDTAIIHCTNGYKPWTHEGSYMNEEWMSLYKRSPFGTQPLKLEKMPHEVIGTDDGTADDGVAHIVSRKGPFIKDWTEAYTVLRLGKFPFVEKYKDGWRTRFKALGIPFLKREWTNFEERTYLFGVCVRAKPHWVEIKHRADELFGRLGPIACGTDPYAGILSQIEFLESMDHG